jgi:hypothetical protein
MVTSKIILLLRRFSKKDLSAFRDFLSSPYFNKKEKLLKFYDELFKYRPHFEEEKIDRAKIYRRLYPKSIFNAQVYKNLSSEIYTLAKEFLSIQNINSNQIEKNMFMLKNLERMEANELYKIELRSFRNKLNQARINDLTFYNRFDLATLEKIFHYNRSNFKKGNELNSEESDELLKFYLVNIFRQRFDNEASRLNFNIRYKENAAMHHVQSLMDNGILEDTLENLQKNEVKNHEIVAMFYNIVMSIININDDRYFEKAKILMYRNLGKFENNIQFIIPSSLLTVCTFKINLRGNPDDYRNAFEIINFQLRRKIYRESSESYITTTEFRSMFMIGMYLKEFSWLKRFIRKYIGEVSPDQRENLRNLLTGIIKFHEKDFEKSLDLINLVKLDQFIYKLDVRKLQLFLFYELDYIESAISLINSFKEFLHSNKNVSNETRRNNLNVLSMTSKLIKLRDDFDEHELSKLETELSESKFVLYRAWFEEKIAELKKRMQNPKKET